MNVKKMGLLAAAIAAVAISSLFATRIFANGPNPSPYYAGSAAIGSYHDENWYATGFYVLVKSGPPSASGVQSYQYMYTNSMASPPGGVDKGLSDAVVTQWSVGGQLQFTSD